MHPYFSWSLNCSRKAIRKPHVRIHIYMSPDTFTCTTDININVHVYLCLCMYTYMYMSLFDQHFVVLYQQNQDRSKFKPLSDGK